MKEKGGDFDAEPSCPVLIYGLSWRDGQWHGVKRRLYSNKCHKLNFIQNS